MIDTGFALAHTSTGVARFTDEFLVLKISPIGTNYRSNDAFVSGRACQNPPPVWWNNTRDGGEDAISAQNHPWVFGVSSRTAA